MSVRGKGKRGKMSESQPDEVDSLENKQVDLNDIIKLMNNFEKKINSLASKDYIYKNFQKIVSEKFVTEC
ncbi:hypothetical protein ACF0H5_006552 [Mactra antiquata]